MAINQILNIPDWRKSLTFTNSNVPPSDFSQIYPGPDKYWYTQDNAGIVKRFALDYQFVNGFNLGNAATDSYVNFRVDINAGSGLTFSYDGISSQLIVQNLTASNLYLLNTFTQGFVLSYNTSSQGFQWIQNSTQSVSGTTGSLAKFTSANSVGDSLLYEESGKVFLGITPSNTYPYIGLGVSQSVNIGGRIYLNNSLNRYLDGTSNNVELRTTSDFAVNSYPLLSGTDSVGKFIDAKTDLATSSNLGYDRQVEFLSGLVSVNQRPNLPALFVNATPPGLTGVSPSSMIRTPTFSFDSTSSFLGKTIGTFGVALGLSGGGIQIKDGTEGQYKVLVSSTTQGHGIWANMVDIGSYSRIPIYQRNGDFNVSDRLTFTDSIQVSGVTYTRTHTASLYIEPQSLNSAWGTSSLNNSIDFYIPNVGATGYANFLMSRGLMNKYGTLRIYDETEEFGPSAPNTRRGSLLTVDISTNGGGFEKGSRDGQMIQLLSSDKFSNSRLQRAWIFTNASFTSPFGFTTGWSQSLPVGSPGDTLSYLARPGLLFHTRAIFSDSISYRSNEQKVFYSESLQRYVFADVNNKALNYSGNAAYGSGGLDTQIVRNVSSVFTNQNFQPLPGVTAGITGSFTTASIPNVIYQYNYSRLNVPVRVSPSAALGGVAGLAFPGTPTMSILDMDTTLGNWIRIESGEYNGRVTQSTGLFVNPQVGSFKGSGVFLTASRVVGIQVSQEVGVLTYQPNGYIGEAYDFISARIANGSSFSGIGSHVGFLAQSKLLGQQWHPTGRRTYDYGATLRTMDEVDRVTYNFSAGRFGPTAWPSFSVYPQKPWGFFAEKDKSNFGGGVLIDIGATFGTSLNAYLEIQGVTGIFNTFSNARQMFDLDGSIVTVSGSAYGPLLPQILLRPGLTPSGAPSGSLFYTPGFLGFVDGGVTYNLIPQPTPVGSGLTGNGVSSYVPVWTNSFTLRGTSSIRVSNGGDGNVGINLQTIPTLPLQVGTSSTQSLIANGVTSSLWNVALGLSGSMLYQDGSHGFTGSVLMADSTGKTNLYPLVLPGPGVTASFARVGFSFSSGYLPLYSGLGVDGPGGTGPSGSSEYQLGPVMRDQHGTNISLLIRPQTQFASSNPVGVGQQRTLTLTIPSLVTTVPSGAGATNSVVEFVMNWGVQTINGAKTFTATTTTFNQIFIGSNGLSGPRYVGVHNQLSTSPLLNQRTAGVTRPFIDREGNINYSKSILTRLSNPNTTPYFYSRIAYTDTLSLDVGAFYHAPAVPNQRVGASAQLNQSIGRYTESVLANNIADENFPNFIGQFDFTKVSSTSSTLNTPNTFIGTYKRTEFGHNFGSTAATTFLVSATDNPTIFSTSSVNLMTGIFVNNQVGGASWSFGSATYSIGVYSRQDVDSGRILRAYDFFASRMGASASLSRIDNHVGFYAQSKVFGTTSLDPTGRTTYSYAENIGYPSTFSFGWTSGNNSPWSFFAESDKAGFGGGILIMGTNSDQVRAVNTTPSYEDILGVYRNGNLPSWLTIQEALSNRTQISLLTSDIKARATISIVTAIPSGTQIQIRTNYPQPNTIVVPTFSTTGTNTTQNAIQIRDLINNGSSGYTASSVGQVLSISAPNYQGSAINGSSFSFSAAQSNFSVGLFSGGVNAPVPLTTSDGDMWHTGTALYFKSGGATYNLLTSGRGITGPTGPAGSAGSPGNSGDPGSRNGLMWIYSSVTTGPQAWGSPLPAGSFGMTSGYVQFDATSNFSKMFVNVRDGSSNAQSSYIQSWKPGDILTWNLTQGLPTTPGVILRLGTQSPILGSASGNLQYIEFNVTQLSGSQPSSWTSESRISLLHQPIGVTGATGIVSIGTFGQNTFFTNGASISSTGILTLGAAGQNNVGLVHTGSQIFSGDKTFYGKIFIGPTSTNGLFFNDDTNNPNVYSGFIGATSFCNNYVYRLPQDVALDRYLKTCTNDGLTYNLVWATMSTGLGGSINNNEIAVGDGSTIVSCADFKFFRTSLDLQAASVCSFAPSTSNCRNVVIGGCGHTMSSNRSAIIGGLSNVICQTIDDSSIIGGSSNILRCTSPNSTIIGGIQNIVECNSTTSIIGSECSRICLGSSRSSILGGDCNRIQGTSSRSSIIGGCGNSIGTQSCASFIIGGCGNAISNSSCNSSILSSGQSLIICNSDYSTIVGGLCNKICSSSDKVSILGGAFNEVQTTGDASSIIGGCCNILGTGSNRSSIIGGEKNLVTCVSYSSIIGGCKNILYFSKESSIIGGRDNTISATSNNGSIISSCNSLIDNCSCGVSIISGFNNKIFNQNTYSSIVGGISNTIHSLSSCSAIIGGQGASMSSSNGSVILGGQGLTLSNCTNMVYVPSLMIKDVTDTGTSITRLLVWNDANKTIGHRLVSSLPFGSGGGGGGTISTIGIDNTGFAGGATISYSGGFATFTLSVATKDHPGLLTTQTQNISGTKSFFGNVFIGDTVATQPTGIYLYEYPGTQYTGFVAPKVLDKNYVYELPSVRGLTGQSLMISSVNDSTTTATISTTWSWPRLGAGLTQTSGGTISLVTLIPNNIVRLVASPSFTIYTASLADNNKLFDVTTGDSLFRVLPPLSFVSKIPGSSASAPSLEYSGYEFRVRKTDFSDGVVSIQIGTNSDINPYISLTRQNQMVGVKYDSGSQSWTGYVIDNGYVSPNTVLGNFGTTHSYVDEYQVVDLNDSVQKAPNYTEGSFDNDWLSGVIFSSIEPMRFNMTSGAPYFFNMIAPGLNGTPTLANSYSLTGSYIGTSSLPAFSMTRGKSIRLKMSGTYSHPAVSNIFSEWYFVLGGTTMSTFTYSTGGVVSNAAFYLEYDIKIRNGGQSGSVYGSGKILFDEIAGGSPAYAIHSYNQGFVDVNLSQLATLNLWFKDSPQGYSSVTVNNTIIERLG